jgi:DNA polymerase III beta subunit
MEFRIAKTEFLRGLRLAQGIADRKSTMPMLANVLLRTQGKNQLLVAATDLNVSLTAELKSQNTGEGGITLGAKNLYELIANAPGDEVTLKKADNHWAEIKSGKVTYRIVGMPDRDFPKVPDHREASYTTLESAVLREMIERTLFSVCNDETRFHLNGVFFESDGSKSRMVSTDGHRLSKVERTIANGPKLSAGVIIPKRVCRLSEAEQSYRDFPAMERCRPGCRALREVVLRSAGAMRPPRRRKGRRLNIGARGRSEHRLRWGNARGCHGNPRSLPGRYLSTPPTRTMEGA